MKQKKEILTRGYKPIRDKIKKNSRYVRSCFNCLHYYQAVGDKEEVCQNPNVVEYDMVYEKNLVFCLHWKPSFDTSEGKFFKNRRSILD